MVNVAVAHIHEQLPTTSHALRQEPLLTAAQVGAHFAMTERAVFNAVARGTLPALRLGRRLRFRLSDIERVLR
jgi:hypothetical protein